MYDRFEGQMVYARHAHPGGTNMRSMSFHSGYEMYFLISGKKRYIVSGETVDLESPAIIFIKPGILHMALSTDDQPHTMAVIGFTDEFLLRFCDLLSSTILAAEYSAVLYIPEKRLIDEFDADVSRIWNSCSDLRNDLLASRLFETICELSALTPARVIRPGANADELVAVKAISAIDSELAAGISIRKTAMELGYSPDELTRLLKRTTGRGWRGHVNDIRLRRALLLLIDTDKRFEDIALDCGISGANYFSEFIKRSVGLTPSEYRARYKGILGRFDPLPIVDTR